MFKYYMCIPIPMAGLDKEKAFTFDGSEGHCKELYSILQLQSPALFQQHVRLEDALFSDGTKSGFKPLILLPGQMECCGKKVLIR